MEESIERIQIVEAVDVIKTTIMQGQYLASKEVTRVQLFTYYSIGRYLSLKTKSAAWGSGALESISNQLRRDMPGLRGFSATNLKNMRLFYKNWQMLDGNSSEASDELQNTVNQLDVSHSIVIPNIQNFPVEAFFKIPFSHHIVIFTRVEGDMARYYYIRRCAEELLSLDQLKTIIKENAYTHQATMPNNFKHTMSDEVLARKAVQMFKDEYQLSFINTEEFGERDIEDIDERVVEQRIVQNIKKFIMTFGQDFTFMGNQYHLEAYGEEFFPDLLFFNRALNAIVVG
jgi:predicted nuclease of restriction endonuclease-like (RecB) superfamily